MNEYDTESCYWDVFIVQLTRRFSAQKPHVIAYKTNLIRKYHVTYPLYRGFQRRVCRTQFMDQTLAYQALFNLSVSIDSVQSMSGIPILYKRPPLCLPIIIFLRRTARPEYKRLWCGPLQIAMIYNGSFFSKNRNFCLRLLFMRLVSNKINTFPPIIILGPVNPDILP